MVAGRQADSAALRDAEVLFLGYGITAPEQRWDDYKVDVRGKVVLVMKQRSRGRPGRLDDVVAAVARAQGRTLTGDDRPDRGSFYRSDQFNFAKIGVPALYLKSGVQLVGREPGAGRELRDRFVKERYHQPSDELDASWKLDGAVEDLQLMVVTLLRVADAPRLPEWRRGDEFEAARKKALGAR